MIVCLAVGVQPWKDGAFDTGNFYALVAFALRRGCDHRDPVGVSARSRR